MKKSLLAFSAIALVSLSSLAASGQEKKKMRPYQETANAIIDEVLKNGQVYEMLRTLTTVAPGRLSGSPAAAAAVEWGRDTMEQLGFDNVHLQPLMVPHWVRGDVEEAKIVNSQTVGDHELTICSLGGSIATPDAGITAEVLEVKSFEELRQKADEAKGKIIFFNRAMDPTKRRTFSAYGGAVNQRGSGAVEAAKVGGVAALVRSMTTATDDVPHTGAMNYQDGVKKIPAVAVSTIDANFLSQVLKSEGSVRVRIRTNSQILPDAPSANVVGDITGSEFPDEIIVIGGHLDSWDKGDGAHDDGAGCAQSIEALRLIKALGLKPKRTLRAVLFMNEENGMRGGKGYADVTEKKGYKHVAAFESDAGGFVPKGLGVGATPEQVKSIQQWSYLLDQIGAGNIKSGGGGADIGPLNRRFQVPVIGLLVDSNRYFDYHHSANDTFDKVNERELELGAAVMAIIAYVLANEGV